MAINETTIRTGIENGRAGYAFKVVNDYVQQNQNNSELRKEYKSYVKKIPAMIQVNGFGQTMAFCLAKKRSYLAIYKQIEKWIRQQHVGLIKRYDPQGNKKIIELIVTMNSSDYRIVTNEAMALLNWMRRFAEGLIDD